MLDEAPARINAAVRTAPAPALCLDDIFAVAEVPPHLSGRSRSCHQNLLLGQPMKVVSKDAAANPGCLDWYAAFAAERAQTLFAAPAVGRHRRIDWLW